MWRVGLAEAEERSAVEWRAPGCGWRDASAWCSAARWSAGAGSRLGLPGRGQTRKADRSSSRPMPQGRCPGPRDNRYRQIAPDGCGWSAARSVTSDPAQPRRGIGAHPHLLGSATVPTRSDLLGLRFPSDGSTLAMTDKSHHVWTYNAQTLTPLKSAQIGDEGPANLDTPIAFSPMEALAVGARLRTVVLCCGCSILGPCGHSWTGSRDGHIAGVRLSGWAYSADGRFLAAGLHFGKGLTLEVL